MWSGWQHSEWHDERRTMNLDIVLIDSITPDGVLTSFKITPKEQHRQVLVDRFRDIYPERFAEEMDLGGTRIYNSQECLVVRSDSRLRSIHTRGSEFSFQFEHMGIPIGPSRESHGGIYNLVLPPGFRFTDFRIVDPYDKAHAEITEKKQFHYIVVWDRECKVQLVEMDIRSNRGSFSFIANGTAVLVDTPGEHQYVPSDESEWRISNITGHYLLSGDAKKALAKQLAEKMDWIDLKPNIFGIGININEIVKSCMRVFRRKLGNDPD
jgi:hypothetical protein